MFDKNYFGKIRSLHGTWLEEALAKAESEGLKKVTIVNGSGCEDWKEGQIIDYRLPEKKADRKEIKHPYPKQVWKVESIVAGTLKSWSSNKEYTTEELGSATFVCLGENYKYLHDKELTKLEIDNEVHRASFGMLKEGKFIIDESGGIGQVTKIFTSKKRDDKATFDDAVANPHRDTVYYDQITVAIRYETRYHEQGEIKFDGSKEMYLDDFLKKWAFIPDEKLEDFFKKVNHVEQTQELHAFKDVLAIGNAEAAAEAATSTALVGTGSKEHLQLMHDKIAVRRNEAESLKAGLARIIGLERQKLEDIVQRKKEELAQVHQHLSEVMVTFKRQMEKIHRLIVTLEIYLGVTEEVIQIAEGEKAPLTEPISLRQQVLFMDEEFGDPKGGGIDHRTITEFEEWLVKSGSYKKVIPEPKSVVIMRPRRTPKDYGNFWANMKLQKLDEMVYIFIRNGDNLYRIMTDHIKFQDRLFPKRAELQEMYDKMNKYASEAENAESDYQNREAMNKMDDVEKEFFYYRRNILLLQGIVFRTEIFTPVPEGLNMMNISTYKNPDGTDRIRFIYDDENALPSGRLSFSAWQAEMNKKIVKGSRVVVVGNLIDDFTSRISENFVRYGRGSSYNSEYATVSKPHNGIYEARVRMVEKSDYETEEVTVAEYRKHEKTKYKGEYKSIRFTEKESELIAPKGRQGFPWDDSNVAAFIVHKRDARGEKIEKTWEEPEFYISYNPKDEVTYSAGWDYDPHERKNNVTMVIYPVKEGRKEQTDEFLINYDALLLDDVEFYLNSRVDRQHYLRMMPVLWELKYKLMEEKQWETGFVQSLAQRLAHELQLEEPAVAQEIWDAVQWWKNEIVTVWKRPISKDDTKALRMITQRVKSRLKSKFKLKIDIGADATKQVQVYKWRGKIACYGKGFTKKEFAEAVMRYFEQNDVPPALDEENRKRVWARTDASKAAVLRESTFTTSYTPAQEKVIETKLLN